MRSINNNDQNIGRAEPKMSECCREQGNEKLCECKRSAAYFNKIDEQEDDAGEEEFQGFGDDFPTSPTDSKLSPPVINCHTDECEVRLIKEWLMLQTDLIQQQNDDIIDKDREIYILRRENEMLKERINTIEKEICVQIAKEEEKAKPDSPDRSTRSSPGGEMTQSFDDDFAKENDIGDVSSQCGSETTTGVDKKLEDDYLEKNEGESESQIVDSSSVNTLKDEEQLVLKSEQIILSELSDIRTYSNDSEVTNCEKFISDYNYLVNICDSNTDSKNNLRMSITRKRVCSNSSALSPNESVTTTTEEKEPHRRFKKKKRRITKDAQILTSTEPYITQAHEVNLGIASRNPDIPDTALEIPRWRHKIYPSCYTMEGTENLDDEVFNKRHLRLEIDERRRKRWDVQRIREQRVIEKLKQRQERVASGSRGEETEPLPSLWPKVEDIKYLEITDELPVSAFGTSIPKITSSEFSLPWLGNASTIVTKKSSYAKRSTIRKRCLRR